MGYVKPSGAPGNSRTRRQPEKTLEFFFVKSKLRASSTKHSKKREKKIIHFTRRSLLLQYDGYVTGENTDFLGFS